MGDFVDGEELAYIPLRGLPHERAFRGVELGQEGAVALGRPEGRPVGDHPMEPSGGGVDLGGGQEAILRVAMPWRCSIRSGRGGRQASMAKTVIGVEEKQLVTHLWMRLQNVSSLSCIFMRGVKRSEPYRRIGAIREVAS